ncbi:FHA domain-containing protein [Streptomyces millisiae]|uniref:FHA domain-containing protein n=1 Tax=Streptomyces millisiae TaxID=3075542 RepID=A0ABU2LT88_9ACTN|nr:FHA domain-containing protein [Streptomyces sp. DSM 44918]MDT0320493.1 FHA domain-containing protein [Streptomyces sp. DSM 44918]
MPTCPNGHQSVAEDWCEVCGHRMLAPAAAMPPPPVGYPGAGQGPGGQLPPPPQAGGYGYPAPQQAPPPPPPPAQGHGGYGFPDATAPMQQLNPTELCPQCRTPRESQAPFCEECRYNFLTNSPTTYIPPAAPGGQQYPGQHGQPGPPPMPGQRDMYGQQAAAPQAPPMPPQHQQQPPQHQQQQAPGTNTDWMLPPPGGPGAPGGPGQYQQQPPPPPYPGQQQPPQQQPPQQQQRPPQPERWLVTIGPDPEYFQAMMRRSGPEAHELKLPAYAPEQQVPLTGNEITIGRRRQSTGEAPDIDLSRPPEDPGVSHRHAVLVQQADGGWAVVDQDSTNGTTVNMAEDPIQPFVPVPLREGDRVHIGAWTTLTLYRG